MRRVRPQKALTRRYEHVSIAKISLEIELQLVDVVNIELVIEQAIVDVLSLVDLVAVGELGCHIVRLFCPDYACREGDLSRGGQ